MPYQEFTTVPAQIDADLSDYPLYLDFSDFDKVGSDIFDTATVSGGDIRAYDTDGTTQLPREIVSFDTTGKTGEGHVKIPALSSSVAQTRRVSYDGLSTEPAADSTYGSENVWSSNHRMVQHMNQDPSGSAPQMLDSTSNDNDGTSVGSMTSGDIVAGQIGDCLAFDGSDDSIFIADDNTLDFSTNIDFTLSAWVKTSVSATNQTILCKTNTNYSSVHGFEVHYNSGISALRAFVHAGLSYGTIDGTTDIADGNWHKVDIVIYRNSSITVNDILIFVDGVQESTSVYSASANTDINLDNTIALRIGARYESSTETNFFNGSIDNASVSSTGMSSGWISTEYNNQNSPSTFYSVSDEQTDTTTITAEPGSYTITGQNVDLLHNRVLSADPGNYTITGQAVDLVYSFGSILPAESGSYAITGQDVNLLHNRVLSVEPGSYVITGQDIDLIHTQILQPGSYTITGQPVGLLHNKKLDIGAGSYAITGQDSTLTFTQNPNKSPFLFYIFTLTGDADGTTDIEIPISSFQARLRSGDPTYLSVVIPGMDQAAAINARPNGMLKVDAAYKVGDIWTQRKTIIQVNFEDIRIDRGTTSKSITLTGHKQVTYGAKTITLASPTYKNMINGSLRYRFAEPSLHLYPGDTVTVDDDTFTANVISYYVNARRGGVETSMEVAEY